MTLPDNVQLEECFKEGLTQSEVMTRANCPRKWYFRYIKRLKKQGSFSWALIFGDAMHRMLEAYYTQLTRVKNQNQTDEISIPAFNFEDDVVLRPDQSDDLQYHQSLVAVLFNRYIKYWKDTDKKIVIHSTEQEIEYEFE